jgi:hypothetical protein
MHGTLLYKQLDNEMPSQDLDHECSQREGRTSEHLASELEPTKSSEKGRRL